MKSLVSALAFNMVSAEAAHSVGQPALPPAKPRAVGPSVDQALDAGRSAIAACLAQGFRTTGLISDVEGVPVVMLSADGAPQRTQLIAAKKVATVLRYHVPSGEIAERVKTDPKLAAEVAADPAIGMAFRGGAPIISAGTMIGAIAVSGAPGGDKDEACLATAVGRIDRWVSQ